MKTTITAIAMVLLLAPLAGSGGLFGAEAFGSPYAPTFGGGSFHYADGLVINGKVFDISGYSQQITVQNLTVGQPAKITLKIFDNAGSYTIKTAAIFLNIRGQDASVASSDTWVQYDVSGMTAISDPHHYIEAAKGGVSYSGSFAYVTFTVTPAKPMSVSDMIVSSTDARGATGYSLVVNALSFVGKASGGTQSISYSHEHCTVTYPCYEVCGDHICKPGEKPKATP
ncbi:MAG: hypothetical protein KGI33_04905 [Thaumarchaeota archaeon]|nr:hypothetical protein [Nitrososphaerota archaeon]